MAKFSKLSAMILVVLAAGSTGANAAVYSISGATVTGLNTQYAENTPGVLTVDASASLASILAGSAAAPGGNVELNKMAGAPATTLTGTLNGNAVTLSSLTLADWTANSNALADAYISSAWTAAYGTSIGALLPTARTLFFSTNAYQRVSDPNISYVLLDNSDLKVGLAGFLDASTFLGSLVAGYPGAPAVPKDAQASEVVKVTYNGVTTYMYGFNATASNVASADGSFSGNYEVSRNVPEPGVLSLLGLGLAGAYLRRRNA